MDVLFPNALVDPGEYLQAQALWRRLFDRIKCEDYRGPMWTEWMSTTFADGTPCYDGSMAIYSQHCAERRKGIKIWQVDPAEDGMTESYLIPSIEPSGEFGEIDSLDISCVLTEENIARVEGLIRLYMVEDLTPEAMIMRIGTQFPKVHKEPLQHPVLVSLDYGLRKHFCALRGTLANCAATYDASPTPGTPINARFSFSRSPGDSAKIEVVAQAKAGGSGLTLTYRISNSDGRLLAEGPRATVGEDMAAPGVQAVADAWLGEITDFVQENRHLFVR